LSFIRAGATFLWSTPDQPAQHLWIAVTDPDPKTNKFVAVMVVTKKSHTDPTTPLNPGDHPFINRESHVDYGTAKPVSTQRLSGDMGEGTCIPRQNLSQGVLKRVQTGLLISERTDNYLKDYCRPLLN
jgi:hypothetical protein